ncbi:MAG: NAD(P)-dependent oxidoreductase [Acidimicrobiales bacterium]|nr:NAD(P)-dependent oxidoreductase [Acidimicrobiales bacterium]
MNEAARVGLLHPGAMGAAVGAALTSNGVDVAWAGEGRSDATRRRAAEAGLIDAGSLAPLLERTDIVLCICPPDAAGDVARSVAITGFSGTYVDANAVSPATVAGIADIVAAGGATFVDGDLIGGPPRPGGATRLYLSGPADAAAAVLGGPGLESVVLGGDVAAASTLKMCYASWTKGSAALLLAIRAAARELGVEDPLLAEWDRSQPGLRDRSELSVAVVPKAWRFVGEMEEIAATFAGAGQPEGFALAAAEIYRRLGRFKDGVATLDEVLATLSEAGGS